MREKKMSAKSMAELERKVDGYIAAIFEGKEKRKADEQGVSKYEFTRAEVLSEDSHKSYNRVRNLAAVLVSASSASWMVSVVEMVTLDMEMFMLWGAAGAGTSIASTIIYNKVLPRINSKIWLNGTNNLLQQVLMSRNVSVSEAELLQSTITKQIGGGGYVQVKTKKNRARRAAPHEIVGSVEIKYPSEHEQELDTVFRSVLATEPDVAKALEAVEKKELPAAKKANKWGV